MELKKITARQTKAVPEECARYMFETVISDRDMVDAIFIENRQQGIFAVANIPFKCPIADNMLRVPEIAEHLNGYFERNCSVLIKFDGIEKDAKLYIYIDKLISEERLPHRVSDSIVKLFCNIENWRGVLNEEGEYRVDLRTPQPGPHYFVNLLLGNRIGYAYPLQTTPKSVVDRLGRGSFRSHADTQVLATRWDYRPEENGFPANRQFYLVEEGKLIFYSADPKDKNIDEAYCIHSQNHTVICYRTQCGLEIKRTIFMLPQYEGLPLATEVQSIEIKNTGSRERKLRIVYTGMFGTPASQALMVDVIYSTIIKQSCVLELEDGSIGAISYEYNPEYAKQDVRFHSMIIHNGDKVEYPEEFCADYNELVGNGTLEKPEGIYKLSSRHSRKGPGFFALGAKLNIKAGGAVSVENFTGAVSKVVCREYEESNFTKEVGNLLEKFSKKGEVKRSLEEVKDFTKLYSSYMQINSGDKNFDAYFNNNLPFQVLYQTFVSRSFAHTQKGYREIGFREIQDIFASMYYFVGMDKAEFAKELIKEWANKVFEFGYAYHNFFWTGKEPGKWSDDALWLVQAVDRYINLTGDTEFLKEYCEIAGTSPLKYRTIYETIKAIISYSGKISIGKHGMPLLDHSDWNDCLQLDDGAINGLQKEECYKKQIASSGKIGQPFESQYSESVMNAFLLKCALDTAKACAERQGDNDYLAEIDKLTSELCENLQMHAWKEDYFARVLFNRQIDGDIEYLGAKGDKLSLTPKLDGTYFLNCFNWSVLSSAASEEQISVMLDTIDKSLRTDYGLKLCSPVDFGKISKRVSTADYFPGDRENGAVFKHANMMGTAAMFKAAKEVNSRALAERLAELGYWTIDKVLPYKALEDPYVICGNPRLCTQYNNSETGENIGPVLSGTSTWLLLTLMNAFGIDFTYKGIELNPILKKEQQKLDIVLKMSGTTYLIEITKPLGFYRIQDNEAEILFDGQVLENNILPVLKDNKVHKVVISFKNPE